MGYPTLDVRTRLRGAGGVNTLLSEIVSVARRFTRSVRLDTDIADPAALEGFVSTSSAIDTLALMGRHRQATGHGAFTWTGPYGSGKSSLAVAFSAILKGARSSAAAILAAGDKQDAAEILAAFRPSDDAWRIAAVLGSRSDPEMAIVHAIQKAVGRKAAKRSADETLASWILRTAEAVPGPGLVLMIDEMGKFLEHAALAAGDVHVFQDIAEISSRSAGRLVVVGILHQAFDEYAHRLSRQGRDEWLKIQGRYVDLPVSLAGEEQIELIARAIQVSARPKVERRSRAAQVVADALRGVRAGGTDHLAARLEACWPLHPLSAAMLGPISRRRFGQSQRSIFGFLTSAEPYGFQEFLASTPIDSTRFAGDKLWDYLRANLEPAILASPDGHRWSTAVDAIERCEARGGSAAHLAILKTIALLDMFKDRSGLQASDVVVHCGIDQLSKPEFEQVVADLLAWSVIVHRKHNQSFAIYAGSDFDIERAIDEARAAGTGIDYRRLAQQAALQPVLAKRHYEETGALRWFEVEIAPLHEAEDRVRGYRPSAGSAGLFLVLISANSEPKAAARRRAKAASELADGQLVIVGWTRDSYRLREAAADLAALEYVRANRPELEGDAIARREVDARIARIAADLDDQLSEALEMVDWNGPEHMPLTSSGLSGPAALSLLASRLADWRYPDTPKLRNELVNRTKPSSNAAAATRLLLRAMIEQPSSPRLGFQGFPPEAGLYVSLLEATGLHQELEAGRFGFIAPKANDPAHLNRMWVAADELLQSSRAGCTLAEIYTLWRAPGFGIRDGLLPIMGTAFLLTRSAGAATYLDDIFRPQLDSYLVDRLLQDASAVRIRAVELSDLNIHFISELARLLSTDEAPVPPVALEVARDLIRHVRALPQWSQRTLLLPSDALALRNLGRGSSDPNQLLFEDLPRLIADGALDDGKALAAAVRAAMTDLEEAYPKMLRDLAATLFTELRFKIPDSGSYADLHRRAATVRGLSGNFRLDALATRLSTYEGELADIEGISSLAANKPSRDWVDRDIDAAKVELAALSQQFLRAEGLAHLKGRADGRVTMTVYISDPSYPAPVAPHIELDAHERSDAEQLAKRIEALIGDSGVSPNVALGVVAQLGLRFAGSAEIDEMHSLEAVT